MTRVLVDTGPLVESFVPGARHHRWILDQWELLDPPVWTCEAVLSEAAFILRREKVDPDALWEMVEVGFLRVSFSVQSNIAEIRSLMKRYENLPMSVADACLVRMSEMRSDSRVITFDKHFDVYRRHGSKVIPLLSPPRT